MSTEVHILLVEDTDSDAALITRQIHKLDKAYKVQVVDNLADLEVAIKTFNPQMIISDYNLPTCSGMEVLEVARSKSPTATFLFVTGTLQDEELAAETILNGADGFILKKHMSVLASKLAPYIDKIKNRPVIVQNTRNRIKQSTDLVNDIKEYMEDINRENISHQDRIAKIREHLEKIKNSL
ncbi:response regulator [Dokdonia sp. Asnod1-B02]|jgi:CheY-like chemotaxis protein|uniref:response regulator n=1 Tax=Dokdonia sp. Asnod1-B02 TaxID=3160573 RepID=UPI0030EE79BC|tara:strand:+ start:19931 stop:20476 length:546 start_codon:yes stop_codon:yes gene_type:complete